MKDSKSLTYAYLIMLVCSASLETVYAIQSNVGPPLGFSAIGARLDAAAQHSGSGNGVGCHHVQRQSSLYDV